MTDSPSAPETLSASRSLLAEALGTLEALGVEVAIDGDPPRYVVDGVAQSEGDVIALASRMAPVRSGRRQ